MSEVIRKEAPCHASCFKVSGRKACGSGLVEDSPLQTIPLVSLDDPVLVVEQQAMGAQLIKPISVDEEADTKTNENKNAKTHYHHHDQSIKIITTTIVVANSIITIAIMVFILL